MTFELFYRKLRDTTVNCSKCCETFNLEVTNQIVPSFREYSLYTESVKNLLKRRDAHQIEHEGFGDIVRSKQVNFDKFFVDFETFLGR